MKKTITSGSIKADEIIAVGISIKKEELADMKAAARVDLNGPAVLAMARYGLERAKFEHTRDIVNKINRKAIAPRKAVAK